ncbi:folylpolyglutamate synthase, mitochondrial-like isoform X2 [Pocillopora damicornis]|uniref:folylpolyglutamate synthase, mitochondrial-like isoform X2 n=1 Tax=Pocillopora damicornis TaxID=46731 RepID=UPI000F555D35|nr:folylpolyglutamate synthase, mitochondrial-like isoform X2 [Pocillopora damicornis]
MVSICKYMVSRRFTTAVQLSAEIMQQRTYEDAVKKLNSLQTNAQVLEQIRKTRGRLAQNNLPEMRSFTERAGVKMEDLDKLSIIHISGTKGKGSTCAFCESILRHEGLKTGFYSSPHLMEVRERIRINGKPLPKETFAKYFFDCWDNLLNNGDEEGKNSMPAYFRFLTLMSFHVFLKEKVDVVILEVGIGGAYDSTNIIRNPVACGVTSLGMDHVSTLGGTIESIAWQKAGIFKPGVPAFTVPQPETALDVVANRAKEIKAPLHIIPPLDDYPGGLPVLGLEGDHQLLNASLAVQLCQTWVSRRYTKDDNHEVENETSVEEAPREEKLSSEPLTKKAKIEVPVAQTFEISNTFRSGLKNTRWCGRNQVIVRPAVTFYLDGAHTPRSMEACARWFKRRADEEKEKESGTVARVLLFNLTGGRDPHGLLKPVMKCDFDHAIFCPNNINLNLKSSDSDLTNFTVSRDNQLRWCVENQRVWMALRGAGFQAHADPTGNCTEITNGHHVIKNGLDDGPYSTIFPCVSQAIRWLLGGKDPLIEEFCQEDLPVPDFITKASRVQVLVGGSLHLVGTVMKVLGPEIVGDV